MTSENTDTNMMDADIAEALKSAQSDIPGISTAGLRFLSEIIVNDAIAKKRTDRALTVQHMLIDLALHDTSDARRKNAITFLKETATQSYVLYIMPDDEKELYLVSARDALLQLALTETDKTIREQAVDAIEDIIDPAVVNNLPEEAKLDFVLPVLDLGIKQATYMMDMVQDPYESITVMVRALQHPYIQSSLSSDDYATFVTAGIRAMTQAHETAEGPYQDKWDTVRSTVIQNGWTALYASEESLRDAGYLNLGYALGDELSGQLNVMETFLRREEFLRDKDQIVHNRYLGKMDGKTEFLEQQYKEVLASFQSVKDNTFIDDLTSLRMDYMHVQAVRERVAAKQYPV